MGGICYPFLPFQMGRTSKLYSLEVPSKEQSSHEGANTPYRSTEEFTYFTLVQKPTNATTAAKSLFGVSCTRQLDASQLKDKPPDVTRSTVQKAVVVITPTPRTFGAVREKLGVVTKAWFAQK